MRFKDMSDDYMELDWEKEKARAWTRKEISACGCAVAPWVATAHSAPIPAGSTARQQETRGPGHVQGRSHTSEHHREPGGICICLFYPATAGDGRSRRWRQDRPDAVGGFAPSRYSLPTANIIMVPGLAHSERLYS
ncbi:hypothetical protein METBIDRAFT_179547 [Metschnikowia bicuspidata var. bicuspidata NRRL YB-4993]|uniref:Uncharacterized protein n=1 Tax=Metschnikowia bicuspidata var. bicuspidata NRRL YB-4993 TaxID=869754 RepID=A0A1A0HBC5_9ASCO|nr:hypothetical protein METBIDRAFT_179547 [Metschnikowia bicuspidata var. bicuspidata NRRL YB-4993]OBA21290.1 hypothetical protein METBIDRAFT_179547 [Metschnikowia bicuspidata var. bicuspidata NRRL YB-4993]